LKILKVLGLQSVGQSIIQAIQETLMLLFISVDFMRDVTRQLSELGDILFYRHGPQFHILKLLPLQLDDSLGNMMHMERSSEFRPVDPLGFLMGFHVRIASVGCRTRELVRGYQHHLMIVALPHL
jgi:hypothetical protein